MIRRVPASHFATLVAALGLAASCGAWAGEGPVETGTDTSATSSATTQPVPPVASPAPSVAPAAGGSAAQSDTPSSSTATETTAETVTGTAGTRAEPVRLSPSRASLLPLAQPLWSDLTRSQQQILEPFSAQWNALPLTEKRAWADLARRFPKMPAEEQQRVSRRIADWAALTPEQRRIARANYRLAQQVARDNVLSDWENYQSMTPEQRSVLGTVGSTSNTAARHVAARNGLAKEAAQPLPRRDPRVPMADGTQPSVPTGSVARTVGPATRSPR